MSIAFTPHQETPQIGYFRLDRSDTNEIGDMALFDNVEEARDARHILIERLFKLKAETFETIGMAYKEGHILIIKLKDGYSWNDLGQKTQPEGNLAKNTETRSEKTARLIELFLQKEAGLFLRPEENGLYPHSKEEIEAKLPKILSIRKEEMSHPDQTEVGAIIEEFDGETVKLAFIGACATGDCGGGQAITKARIINGLKSTWPLLQVDIV